MKKLHFGIHGGRKSIIPAAVLLNNPGQWSAGRLWHLDCGRHVHPKVPFMLIYVDFMQFEG
jgi:hypothetical protein